MSDHASAGAAVAAEHRAVLDAIDARCAAYRDYARALEAERTALGDGDGDRALGAAERAVRGFAELQAEARALAPRVARVREHADEAGAREVERHMDRLLAGIRAAEAALQSLGLQLAAWRDAYGRELARVGLPPGRRATAADASTPPATRVTLLDRRG